MTRDGPIVTLTFNRPEARNALTWAMYERLYQTCEEVDADDSVRVLILRGAGGKAFVAGTDISQFTTFTTGEDGITYERELDRHMDRLERVRKPVIAQIQGYATGAGFEILTTCDLRIATPDARFGAPIARRGTSVARRRRSARPRNAPRERPPCAHQSAAVSGPLPDHRRVQAMP